jgi:hypothetical protein
VIVGGNGNNDNEDEDEDYDDIIVCSRKKLPNEIILHFNDPSII